MKKIYFYFLLLWFSNIEAQNQEVQKTIETFFEGFHSRDTLVLQSVCSEKLILQSIKEGAEGNILTDEQPNEFFKSIAGIPNDIQFLEKILSYSIQIDGSMAQVWTPYEFYVNDKLSHKGVNVFTLFKEKESWKLIYLIDTRRK